MTKIDYLRRIEHISSMDVPGEFWLYANEILLLLAFRDLHVDSATCLWQL